MKINKQNIMSKKASMSYLQILILMISSFAFAYLIYSATEVNAQTEIGSAIGYGCCEKTINESYCQFVPEENCNESFRKAPTECEYVDYCKPGCCFSQSTGWCNENTPERSCQGGIWKNDAACNIAECQRGCCVLGRNAMFTTQRNCQAEAGFLGLATDFRADIRTELECIFLAEKDEEGACVYEEDFVKTCKFTTRESCRRIDGDFYKNVFCSDSALETDCTARERKGCLDGEDSVYWFDSCGNREEVAEECSIFTGTICGQVRGEYECKSIDCEVEIDGKKVTKKNGESWCEYDGTIGEGRDVVGSRHIKHICFMGEERVEPCEDYRNQICVQSDVDLGNGETFSEAACRINNWRSCIEYSTLENAEERTKKCQENPDCFIKGVHVDDFNFDICVPKYPPGFDLISDAGGNNADDICAMGTQNCTVIYIKDWKGRCKPEVNIHCRDEGFTKQMNELCTSLGDCGAYVNIAGNVTTDGYDIRSGSRLSRNYLNDLKQYAIPKPGQKAEPGNLSFLGNLGLPIESGYERGGGLSTASMVGPGITGLGALGIPLMSGVTQSLAKIPVVGPAGARIGAGLAGTTLTSIEANVAPTTPITQVADKAAGQAFGDAVSGAVAVLAVTSIVRGINPDMSFGEALVIGAAVTVGVYVLAQRGALTFLGIKTGMAALRVLGWIGLAFAIFELIIGAGKVCKKVHVTYTCRQWQPPTGGKDCDKCNGDAFKPCSPYRCKSLGQTCEFTNEGTEDELCVDNSPNDVSSPRISPLLGVITEGYQYYNIKNNGFEVADLDGNCIPEFTNVLFGIKTTDGSGNPKPAQCKIGYSAMQDYDEMEVFGRNSYTYNHTTILNLPSPELLRYQYNLTDEEIRNLSEVKFYVKCKSRNGVINEAAYTIKTCVKPGPDRTAPYIEKIAPTNGAYIAYNATQQALNLWTNEPANCKWSVESGDYEAMENSMECQTDFGDRMFWGWKCNLTLDVSENTKFYIRCRDLSENNNTMRNPYTYELVKSESNLEIIEIRPASGEEIIAGTEPMTLTLEAFTSGGAEDGKADCSFRFGETGSYIRFRNTFSNSHSQVFSSIIRGTYKIYVRCEDVAGNAAESSTEFEVKIDTSAPRIARVYYNGDLRIATDENAVCAYSFIDSRCRFDIENSTQAELMSGEEKEHSTEWQTENTYYIKCKDSYGNEPGRCSIVVRPYELM